MPSQPRQPNDSPDVARGASATVKGTDLGDRMKGYEDAACFYLTRRMPLIVRVDGKAFHSLTRGYDKPWSIEIRDAMLAAAEELSELQGAKLAYMQSDEISVLLTDYDALNTDAWFDKNLQKVVSVAASIAAVQVSHLLGKRAHFDARAFVLPKEEVCNYFIWRQRDAERNSIQGLAQSHFSPPQLHGLNTSMLQEKLFSEKGINWSACEVWQKRGLAVTSGLTDWETPQFTADREYIDRRVYLPEAA